MTETLASIHHDIKIELTGWDEPNNGRMLHVADLYINGQNANETYFKDWNRLDQRLEKYTMDSVDGKFVFVPSESGGFLINGLNLEQIKLPYKGISTVTFLGNSFHDNLLLLIHSDEIIIVNLLNHVSTRVPFPEENIHWAELNDKKDLLVTYYDKNSQTLKKEIFDLKKQTTIQNEL
ncbi:MAG: hypothetical protein V4506_09520 [Bacteroidota bacterium]